MMTVSIRARVRVRHPSVHSANLPAVSAGNDPSSSFVSDIPSKTRRANMSVSVNWSTNCVLVTRLILRLETDKTKRYNCGEVYELNNVIT